MLRSPSQHVFMNQRGPRSGAWILGL
ncbi:hypothetical protein BM590_A0804 [Brucella melitensis M5-90]|nr:hypothetical protein BM590_A0804 [Brucella melitensis M5-90]